jgi:dipeptidyl aminopeptidase/acylaminoacyl peptidase
VTDWSGYGFGESPWLKDNAGAYWDQSPIKYAPNIRTHTLILSNTGDPRVTVTQSYKLYHALKANGVPLQFIAYPIPGHFLRDRFTSETSIDDGRVGSVSTSRCRERETSRSASYRVVF